MVHCSMDPANQDMQVAHIHCLLESVDFVEVGKNLKQVRHKEAVVVAGFRMEEEFENIQA